MKRWWRELDQDDWTVLAGLALFTVGAWHRWGWDLALISLGALLVGLASLALYRRIG